MIKDEIRRTLSVFPSIQIDVLAHYLALCYNLSPAIAQSSVHKAVIAHDCYFSKDNESFVSAFPNTEITSKDVDMSKALRFALEFMAPLEKDFLDSRVLPGRSFDCLLNVIIPASEDDIQDRLLQISFIHTGRELAMSRAMADNGMPAEMRQIVCRVGIVEPSFRPELVKKVGYMMFVPFGKDSYDFSEKEIINTDEATRWDDVKG